MKPIKKGASSGGFHFSGPPPNSQRKSSRGKPDASVQALGSDGKTAVDGQTWTAAHGRNASSTKPRSILKKSNEGTPSHPSSQEHQDHGGNSSVPTSSGSPQDEANKTSDETGAQGDTVQSGAELPSVTVHASGGASKDSVPPQVSDINDTSDHGASALLKTVTKQVVDDASNVGDVSADVAKSDASGFRFNVQS